MMGVGRTHRRQRLWLPCFVGALLMSAALMLPSCGELGEGFPDIASMTVAPSSIPKSDTGMGDETVDVVITVSGFQGTIVEADAFIQLTDTDRIGVKDELDVDGNTLTLVGIKKSWFGQLEADNYQIGARVSSDAGETVEELDLATVSITP